MAIWGRVRALVVKEFLAIWKDPRSRAVVIGPPLIQLLVFGYAATFNVSHVATAIYNEDHGALGRRLAARFEGSPAFDVIARPRREGEVRRLVDSRRVSLVVHIGQGFSRDLLSGRTARVQLVVDGRESNTALMVTGYAQEVVAAFNRQWAAAHGERALPARLEVHAWFNPNLLSRWFFIPGIVALLTLVVTMVVTALSVAREREIGTFEQLLVTPLHPAEILLGKSLPALAIGLAEATAIITVAVLWFGVPLRGSLPLLYLALAVYLLAVTGMGLMISAIVRTQQQAILGAFLFVVPAVILSGFATPIANMPDWVQAITLANPMRYFLVIVRGVFLQAMPAPLVLGQIWPMVLIGLATLGAAGWLFRRNLY